MVTVPFSLARATLQGDYLSIYLEINDAEHLVKQADYRGALDDFRDCYAKLSKIHESDPDWETALVVHRMADCKEKILELEPLAAQPVPAPPAPVATAPSTPTPGETAPAPPPNYSTPAPTETSGGNTDEVNSLKQELQAVKDELRIIKAKFADSQAQLETYRIQLQTVNAQLAAANNQGSVDERMGKLLSDNKDLTAKLAAAQREIDDLKSNPKSKIALAQAQLKNLQDQYAASQEANKALQDTTTTLKTQLDQAQADLMAANQRLADLGTGSPEYQTLKRENEVMRDILTRELQEQAHRDMAKRLVEEEFDTLKLKSKVLQEHLDEASSVMSPPTTDEERALLASLKVPGPDVAQAPDNNFSAPAGGPPVVSGTDPTPTNPPSPTPDTTPSTSDTNMASATLPVTNPVSDTPSATTNNGTAMPPTVGAENVTNQPPVNIVMNDPPPAGGDPAPPTATTSTPDPSPTTAPSSVTPPPASAPTPTPAAAPDPTTSATPAVPSTPANVPDPHAPLPPVTPPGQSAATPTVANTAVTPTSSDPNAPTTSHIPAGTESVTTTTTTTDNGGGAASNQDDPTQYSTKARLPDDMRETAQDAADLFKNQKYDESAAKYQSIIEKYPESLYAWSNLGVVRFQQGKYDDALKALQQAVKLSPTDAFSYSNLGIVYYQLNQYENAIDALNSAKALDPNDAKTHNYLGCAESQKGWQEVAEREFRKAIEIDPNFGDAHFNLALVYATSKPPSLELARREYNRALELGIAHDERLEKLLAGPQP
jgi:tetratricopeptide (TPR) repeat protein